MPLTDQGALTQVKRHNFAPEAGQLRGAPGAFVNGRAYSESSRTFGLAQRPNPTQMNSRRATYATRPGEKTFQMVTKILATEYLYADWKGVFASALGKELAAAPLTLNPGSGTVLGANVTAGTPDPIVRVGLTPSGKFYIVPVKSFNVGTGDIVWAYQLPALGGDTITSVENASQRSGGCFVESLDPPTSFAVETDQGGEPNGVGVRGQGNVPDLSINLDLANRLTFDLTWMGVDWLDPVTNPPTALADPVNDWTNDFAAQDTEVLFQQLSPVTVENCQQLTSYSMKLSPNWIRLDGTLCRLSTGQNPGSPAFSWKRDGPFQEDIAFNMRLQDPNWIQKRKTHEHGFLFFVHYDGDPGRTGTRAIALFYRNATLNDHPEEVDNGGLMAHNLKLKVEDPLDVDAIGNLKTRLALAMFMT